MTILQMTILVAMTILQMTILEEKRLSLNEAARKVGVHPSTVWRWCLTGCRGIKLDSFNVGAKRFTTAEALQRFIEATTAAASGGPMPSTARTPKQRERAIEKAERELAKQGI